MHHLPYTLMKDRIEINRVTNEFQPLHSETGAPLQFFCLRGRGPRCVAAGIVEREQAHSSIGCTHHVTSGKKSGRLFLELNAPLFCADFRQTEMCERMRSGSLSSVCFEDQIRQEMDV